MLEKEITFDRVVRWLIAAIIATALVWLVNRLSSVLLPFFIAWILAYMIHPFVIFLEKKCRLKYRVLSIAVALLIVLAVLALALFLVVPPIIEESVRMAKLISVYFNDTLASSEFLQNIQSMLQSYASDNSLMQLIQHSSVMDVAENLVLKAWGLLSGTLNFALGLLGSLVVLLYLFFILLDYEKISEG
jgi:predicted PurR-regulated permease PerM